MSVEPIASSPLSPSTLIKWRNEPVLQAYSDLNQLTHIANPALFFAEPVLRWEQRDSSGETIPGRITWYGPECYDMNPRSFRPLPEWGDQQAALTSKLTHELKTLAATATSEAKSTLLEAALVIPSLHAVLSNEEGLFILCPWGRGAENAPSLPFSQTPLGQLVGSIVPPPRAQPQEPSREPEPEPEPVAPKPEPVPPPSPSRVDTPLNATPAPPLRYVLLPARDLPRWLVVCLNILTAIIFFFLAFWAGTLFLLRWMAGISLAHPFSPSSLSMAWHLWSSSLHASPVAPDEVHTIIREVTP